VLRLQKTVAKPATLEGVGLHSGTESRLTFRPAPVNHGIVFQVAAADGPVEIRAQVDNVLAGDVSVRHTTLAGNGVEIHTVEHVLGALAGLGITNCQIELEGQEPPEPLDGSALPIIELLEEAGIADQGLPAPYYRIPGMISFREGDVEITAEPADRFLLTFYIAYDDPLIGTQQATFEITPEIFRREIAPARTFALKKEVSELQAMGLAKGGTLFNALVIEDGKLLGAQELRFPDEFVRHKVLDLLGDLSLLGMPLQGHVKARCSGHATNLAFTRLLARRESRSPSIYPPRKPVHWDICSIMEVMPHRYPFLLVDRICELEPGKRVVGYKNVSVNEPFFPGHFPGHPIMPAVLIIEAMAQTGGVLLLSSIDDPSSKLVYFSGIDQARFRQPVTPGDQLRFELEMVKLRGPICKMRGVALVDGEKVAEADLMSTVVDR